MTQVYRSVCEALWGMCAADAMSMPVHWYYNVRDIRTDFGGWIRGFNAPKDRHPSSILTLSNAGGSGRTAWTSGNSRPVVGNVILHDKLKFWKTPGGSVHYHQGLQAGQNTLNLLCALRAAQVLSSGRFASVAEPAARAAVLSDYVQFLTTPGSHNDTYAESFHRSFFSDWQELRPTSPNQVLDFAEKRYKRMMNTSVPDSQLNAIGCLPMAIPFVLLSAAANEDEAVSAAVELVKLTHPYPKLDTLVAVFARALHATLNGACLKQQAEQALKSPALNVWDTCQHYLLQAERLPNSSEERLKVHQNAVEALGLACYTKGALSSLFYLAYVFHNDVKGGILTNTNCGGGATHRKDGAMHPACSKNAMMVYHRLLRTPWLTFLQNNAESVIKTQTSSENCNRGAALGALLGARAGYAGEIVPQDWKDGLRKAKEEIPKILENLP